MTLIKRALDPAYLDDLIAGARPDRPNPYSEGKLAAADLMVPLDDITRDESLQPRQGVKESHVKAIQDAIESGVDIAPIVLYQLGDTLALVDGWHRYAAHQRAGKGKIRADVYEGDREDATAHAGAANVGDKLGLTASEKVSFLKAILRLPKYARRSDRALGRMVGTSPRTVAKYRTEMDRAAGEGAQNAQPDTRSVSPPTDDLAGIEQRGLAPGRVMRRTETALNELKPRPIEPGTIITLSGETQPDQYAVAYVAAYTSRSRKVGVGWLREAGEGAVGILAVAGEIPGGFANFFKPDQLTLDGLLIIPLELRGEPLWAQLRDGAMSVVWYATGQAGEVWMVWGRGSQPRKVPRRVGALGELISALDAGTGLLVEM
jgi:ParB-like chromosome segregation protein Spo0J